MHLIPKFKKCDPKCILLYFFRMFNFRLSQAIGVSMYLILAVTTTSRTAKRCSFFMCLEPTCNGMLPSSIVQFDKRFQRHVRFSVFFMSSYATANNSNGVEKRWFGCVFPMQEAFADLAGMAKKNDLEASQLFLQCSDY